MASCDGRETLQDVGSIWNFLDSLSTTNPDEYKRYINKVLKEGADMGFGAPTPEFVVQTEKSPQMIPVRKYFINIASWCQVPEQASQEGSIPMCAGKLRKEVVDKEWACVLDVCLNANVLKGCGSSDIEKCSLVELVLKYVEDSNKPLQLSRKYHFLPQTTTKYKGNRDVLLNMMFPTHMQNSLEKTLNTATTTNVTPQDLIQEVKSSAHTHTNTSTNERLSKEIKMSKDEVDGSMSAATKTQRDEAKKKNESLLKMLKESALDKPSKKDSDASGEDEKRDSEHTDEVEGGGKKYDPVITANLNAPTLRESSTKVYTDTEKQSNGDETEKKLARPKTEMDVDKTEGTCELTVYLPGVTSVTECDLEVYEGRVSLLVINKYKLQLDLPLNIDMDSSKAKFVKDLGILLVTAKLQV